MILGVPIGTLASAGTALAAFALVDSFLVLRHYWASLPERIPIHFWIDGKPDKWGSKQHGFMVPVIGLVLFGLLAGVGYFAPIDPTANPAKNRAYLELVTGVMNAEMMLMMLWIERRICLTALNKTSGMGRWSLPVLMLVIFSTIFVLVKSAPQFVG